MAPKPIYDQFDPNRQQFRLLHLTSSKDSTNLDFQLRTYEFEDYPEYRALSYAWGPIEGQEILLSGQKVFIRRNLYQFLEVHKKMKYRVAP
jgi:hypothetical protein